ncbi:hypothetical protein TRICI_004111 [Trichomonascus ciferrii]|uniref:DDE Tnp4 domain-containing protein n=1 Tax=Trichomonascus ciferrii TaxID=44093 RepID=A0A642V1V7_9ASCO|nr:hypothetical protein TRICI_004111 [Trichomonascus ciferrii]
MRRIPGNRKVPKRPSIPRLMDDPCWNRWKDHFHVTKDSFYNLLRKIIRDPVFRVFEEKRKAKDQLSVKHQLCITLKYFASPYPIKQLASDFGVSEGMVYNAINRVTDALLNLSDKYLSWPSPERRAAIAYDKDNPLPGCIGFIDGTKSRLTFVPEWKEALFYSDNNQYSISSQAVATMRENSSIFFLGFLALFTMRPHTGLLQFPRMKAHSFQAANISSGTRHIHWRVAVENAFGRLKSRFPIVRVLRERIRKKKRNGDSEQVEKMERQMKRDLYRIMRLIRAAVVLHNILVREMPEDIYDATDEVAEEEREESNDPSEAVSNGTTLLREKVKEDIFHTGMFRHRPNCPCLNERSITR